jgi:hypothetical protein
MCQRHHRHSIFCVLPPYMLRSVARNGSAAQRNAANRTLSVDGTFRALRASLSAQIPAAQRRRVCTGSSP